MKTASESKKVYIAALMVGFLFSSAALGDTIKTLHIQLPNGGPATDMHVTFFGKVNKAPHGTPPNNLHPNDRTGDPSDRFDGVSGVGTATLNFAGIPPSVSSLSPGQTDNFNVGIMGDPVGGPTAANIVTKVEFTKDDVVFRTLMPGNEQQTKEFKKYVTGFTNDEFFDFSNTSDAQLFLLNIDASLNLRYILSDFKVYKDLPLSNFTVNDFQNTVLGTLVFSTNELIIGPGSSTDIHLGSVMSSTYALATIGTIIVEDLTDGSSQSYGVPQGYGQTVSVIPEPSTFLLLLWSICIGLIVPRNRRYILGGTPRYPAC